jgi:hypothetical protein
MALGTPFQNKVLSNQDFKQSVLCFIADEAHAISEWGKEDFRPEYGDLPKVIARIRSDLPTLAASATIPPMVKDDIFAKLALPKNTKTIAISNQKLNISLSVRTLQHPQTTRADLITLFPPNVNRFEDFPQTIVYCKHRPEAEEIQDFLRHYAPDWMPKESIEFYHRHIAQADKDRIACKLKDGSLAIVIATDALGMGMDFRHIMRVVIWMVPRTFLSLVQYYGRCVRDMVSIGEAILFVTTATLQNAMIELEELGELSDSEEEPGSEGDANVDDPTLVDREVTMDALEEPEEPEDTDVPAPGKRRQGKAVRKGMTPIQLQDRKFLLKFIATEHCRWRVWNDFFGNSIKASPLFSRPEGIRCCDNCQPHLFPRETVEVVEGKPRPPRGGKRPTLKQYEAVVAALNDLREELAEEKYGVGSLIYSGKTLMSDSVIDELARRSRQISNVEELKERVNWAHVDTYADKVIPVIQVAVRRFPDAQQEAARRREQEESYRQLIMMARQEFLSKFRLVADGCYKAVTEATVTREVGTRKRKMVTTFRSQMFMTLPSRRQYPDYYTLILKPISIANIQKFVRGDRYQSLGEYIAAWHQMFGNAREYNVEGSDIYEDANELEKLFDTTVRRLAEEHYLSLPPQMEIDSFQLDEPVHVDSDDENMGDI